MRRSLTVLPALVTLFMARTVVAAPITWTGDAPARTTITGGPWTLGQGPASASSCANGYPTANPGTFNFAPYYFPFVVADAAGDTTHLTGYFDYRPKAIEEAIVAATSSDGGKTWTFADKVLEFTPNSAPYDCSSGSDDGQGHPFVMDVGGHRYLYTLDRDPGPAGDGGTSAPGAIVNSVDLLGLVVHEVHAANGHPLGGVPASETPVPTAATRTTGLLNPDAIFGIVPGKSPLTVLYLQKQLDPSGDATKAVTTMRLATTTDGMAFNDVGAASGLDESGAVAWIGPRGTIVQFTDGHYGLFYSGGVTADADNDAFHFVGYAESTDAKTWTVVQGVKKPVLAIDATDPRGAPADFYAGRVYDPSVVFDATECHATMLFAGYNT
jgi:hypothetical protein